MPFISAGLCALFPEWLWRWGWWLREYPDDTNDTDDPYNTTSRFKYSGA